MSNEEGAVVMICCGGLFIIGKKYGKKVVGPRVFQVLPDPEDASGEKKLMHLSPLPTTPPSITIVRESFFYPVPAEERNLLALYHKVTHPEEKVEAPKLHIAQPANA